MRDLGERAPRGESGYDKHTVNRQSFNPYDFVCFIAENCQCQRINRSKKPETLGLCSRTSATTSKHTHTHTYTSIRDRKETTWLSHGYTVLPRSNSSKNWKNMSLIPVAPLLCLDTGWCHLPDNTQTFSQKNRGIHQTTKRNPDRTKDLERMEEELNELREILVDSSSRREVVARNQDEEQQLRQQAGSTLEHHRPVQKPYLY